MRRDQHMKANTASPLDMRILVLEKTRISGKSHTKNQKVVILYMRNLPLMPEMHLFRKGKWTSTCK